MAAKDRYKNPNYYRDYFRKQGEARREYLRKRYKENPTAQALASRRYQAKPEKKALIDAKNRRYRENNKERLKQLRKARADREALYRLEKILQRHGVTLEWYERTLEVQGGRCAICGADNPGVSKHKRLHIDHCHRSGKPRGLLCNGCNRGIGYLGDSPVALFAAAQYLLRHQEVREVS